MSDVNDIRKLLEALDEAGWGRKPKEEPEPEWSDEDQAGVDAEEADRFRDQAGRAFAYRGGKGSEMMRVVSADDEDHFLAVGMDSGKESRISYLDVIRSGGGFYDLKPMR